MDVTIVGSGTVVPDPERVCAGVFAAAGPHRVLLDCGPGVVHHMARFGIAWHRLTHLALTHFHNDHIGDVPILLFALKHGLAERRTAELTVLGPPGTGERLERMADAFGAHVLSPGFPVAKREIEPGAAFDLGDGARLRTLPVPHTGESVAYRLEAGDAVLGYTGDTGYDAAIGRFFVGVDALIAECSLPENAAMDTHLTPERVAALARAARPERLLLTHIYPQLPHDEAVEGVRQAGWDGETTAVKDGFRIRLP